MSLEIRYFEGWGQSAMDLPSVEGVDSAVSDQSNSDYKMYGAPDIPYATLETGVWKLDGTRKLLSEEEKFFICGKTDTVMTVRFNLIGSPPSLLSLFFSESTEQWPAMIYIDRVDIDGNQERFTIYPDGPVLHFSYYDETLNDPNTDYKGYVITLYPKVGQRAKIRKITIGTEKNFGEKELSNVNLVTEFDPSLASLPIDVLNFQVRTTGSFRPIEGSKVTLYKNDQLEHTMWVKDVERISKYQYRISCQSLIGNLNKKYYGKIMSPGGEINGPRRNGNAWSYAEYVIRHISDYGSRFQVQYTSTNAQTRKNEILIGYLPVCLEKEALQQVLFAIGLAPSTIEGTVDLAEIKTDVTHIYTNSEILSKGNAKELKPVRIIEVYRIYEKYVEQYWKFDTKYMEIVEIPRIAHALMEPLWEFGEYGFDYGAGWVKAEYPDLGDGFGSDTYIEYPKVSETREIAGVLESRGTTLTIDNCTLIHGRTKYSNQPPDYPYDDAEYLSSGVLDDIFDRMEFYVQHRILVEQEVIITNQHAGDYVRTLTPWGTTVEGWIISMDSTITQNGHRARIKILGKEVS